MGIKKELQNCRKYAEKGYKLSSENYEEITKTLVDYTSNIYNDIQMLHESQKGIV